MPCLASYRRLRRLPLALTPVITVAANVSGGVVGKMISPQSIAVAAAAGQLVGRESELFRFTVKHSFIMLLFICCLVLAQAYLFSGIVPDYQPLSINAAPSTPDFATGYTYLGILLTVLVAFAIAIMSMNKKKSVVG